MKKIFKIHKVNLITPISIFILLSCNLGTTSNQNDTNKIIGNSSKLEPLQITNTSQITFTNLEAKYLTIVAITSSNPNITIATEKNYCLNSKLAYSASCVFNIIPYALAQEESSIIKIQYADGRQQNFNLTAKNTNLASFSANNAGYLVIRYQWLDGDLDIATGISITTPNDPLLNYFNSQSLVNCVGYNCNSTDIIYRQEAELLNWGGDNEGLISSLMFSSGYTREEDVLLNLTSFESNIQSFSLKTLANWYQTKPESTILNIVFEAYPKQTTFKINSNQAFITNADAIITFSANTKVDVAGSAADAQLISTNGLNCNITPSQAGLTTLTCSFEGKL